MVFASTLPKPHKPILSQSFGKELANSKGEILKFFSIAPSQENFYNMTNPKKFIYQDSFLVPRQINKAWPITRTVGVINFTPSTAGPLAKMRSG